jgi:DNA-binding transcriptional regulator YbjK
MARPMTHREPALRRRAALLEAARDLVAERGSGAVTHRAVAERAGVAPANTSYFFSSIDDLLNEAIDHFVRQAAADAADGAKRATGSSPAAIADAVASGYDSDDTLSSLALVEAYLYAARNPAARPVVTEMLASARRNTELMLEAAGARRAHEGAASFLALVDGFTLHWLADPASTTRTDVGDALRALFIAFAMDDDDLAAWERRLRKRPRRARRRSRTR